MATRRSRLQFRPNIGPKTGKASSASPASKPQPKPKESDASATPSVEINKEVHPTPSDQSQSEESNDALASVVQSVNSDQEISKETTDLNESTNLDSREVEQPGVTEKTDSEQVEQTVDKAETAAVKTEVKPKSRSRFPKPRPNLADSGRPKTRAPTSQVANAVTASVSASTTSPVPPPEQLVTNETSIPTTPTSPVKQSTTKDVVPQPCTEKDLNIIDNENRTEVPVDHRPAGVQRGVSESADKKANSAAEKKLNAVLEKRIIAGEKRKEHHSHRRLPSEYEPPNRQKLTMGDLIYWNPRKNVLKPKTKNKQNTSSPKPKPASAPTVKSQQEGGDVENDGGEDDSLPVPQVKIGPDGKIILNEESLVIDNQEKDNMQDMEIVEEDESRPCGGFYGNRIQSRRWNVMETKQFYRALATVGTDFTMLMKLFPDRTRKEIKNKFKKEEKYHRILVDKAIDQRQKFDMAILEKFEQERRDYLEFVKSEEVRVKQQKLAARLEKQRLREEKRKERMKENQLRRSQRKRRKTMYDDVPEEVEEETADRDMDIVEDLHSKRKEVVEILINMSYGCPTQQESNNSSDDGEKQTEAVPFVPRSVKPVSEVKHVLPTNIQENPVVDLEVCTTPMNESPEHTTPIKVSPERTTPMKVSPVCTTPMKVSPVCTTPMKVSPGSLTTRAIVPNAEDQRTTPLAAPPPVQRLAPPVVEVRQPPSVAGPSDAVARLQEEMANKRVQMILVPEESAGQTVIHVYIVPEGADSVTVDGRTVMLSPTHTPSPGQSMTHCPGQLITQGSGQTVTQGSGQLITQGPGQSIIQGSEQMITQGPGQTVTQGSGQSMTLGPGQSIIQGSGQSMTRGPGLSMTQGPGQLMTQGTGLSMTQGPGQSVTQGTGLSVTQGPGQSVTQGTGQSVTQGPGQMVSPRYSAACPTEVKPLSTSLLSPNLHQACSPAPCVSFSQNSKNENQVMSNSIRQPSFNHLGKDDSAINKSDDTSSQPSVTGGTCYQMTSSAVSALQEKAVRTKPDVIARCSQSDRSSQEAQGHHVQGVQIAGYQTSCHQTSSLQTQSHQTSSVQTPSHQISGSQTPDHQTSSVQTPSHQISGPQTPDHQTSSVQTPSHQISGPQTPGHQTSSVQTPGHQTLGHQMPVLPILKISSSQNSFIPLPSPSKVRKLSPVSEIVQSSPCSTSPVTSSSEAKSS